MKNDDFAKELEQLAGEGLLRSLTARPCLGGKYVDAGRTILNFASNDYLDLARDERLKAAAIEAVAALGCGATASRLMAGSCTLHDTLEHKLAQLVGRETSLAFGSGFLTNLGVLAALAGRRSAVFADRLNHASLLDGARVSGAGLFRYRHADVGHLEELLAAHPGQRRIIVSDSVFSMDGDVAPIADLAATALRHGALLVIDEAHAIGVFGPDGGGVCRGLPSVFPDVIVGTMSKALGGYGGFAAGSRELRDLLVNKARSFIYSTALPPACIGSACEALDVVAAAPDLGERLLARAKRFRSALQDLGFDTGRSTSQIIPLMLGDNQCALSFSRALKDKGILAIAVRPPTVPAGTARLRLSVTLAHTDADLEQAAGLLAETARTLGVI